MPQHTTTTTTPPIYTSTYMSSHNLEAAVSALCQKVFGAPLVIEPATTEPTPAPALTPDVLLQGTPCPRCLWTNCGLRNYGVRGQPDWMCHGCATKENQRLGRIDSALLKLRGIKAITSLDAAEALGQAGAVIADKEATIQRLKVKLEALEGETKRLTHLLDHAQEGNRKRDGQAQMAKVLHDIQVAALVGHRDRLQKERDTFKALAEALSQKATPQYRLLDADEDVQEGDEYRNMTMPGHEEWLPSKTQWVGKRCLNPNTQFRRKL